MMNRYLRAISILVIVWIAMPLQAATVPFTEDFTADSAHWKDASAADLVYVASGGPTGDSYVTGTFSFSSSLTNDTPVLLRGQSNYDASNGAFAGNWISDAVTELTAWVRHDALVPLNFFTRISTPANYPGAVAIDFIPVMPNTWTKITFDVSASSSQFVTFEMSDYSTIFSNVANVQFGVMVPAALEGYKTDVSFDLDQPTIIPEPATIGILTLGMMIQTRRCR